MGASRFPEALRFRSNLVHPEVVVNFLNSFRWKPTKQFDTYIYFISDGEFVKIGIANNPMQRLLAIQIGNARELKLLFTIPIYKWHGISSSAANDLEIFLHKGFGDNHIRGEWFDILHRIDVSEWVNTFGCEALNPYFKKYLEKEAM